LTNFGRQLKNRPVGEQIFLISFRLEKAIEWDDHTIVTWVYEGEDVIYLLG
jgi:hypothetical protein